ncbi:hypothetical protein VYU27_010076, partial [Nannochloropsis oceanica]
MSGGEEGEEEEDSSIFTLLQWNIMADTFSSPSLYTRVPAIGVMEWGLRRVKILEEITRWQPDVVTLQ